MTQARRVVLACFVAACAYRAAAYGQVAKLDLVKDGAAAATIVVPADADTWTRKAADWVRHYVREATGAELPIAPDDGKATGTLISVGHTALAKKAEIETDDLKYDGCKLIVKGNVPYLIGRDQKGPGGRDPFPILVPGSMRESVDG